MADEVETMAWNGETPWHGLGTRIPDNLSPREMQVAAGLDWEVVRVPLHAFWNGKPVATEREALIRNTDGKILTYISPDWNPVQNEEAFELFADAVETGGMKMHTAGSLRGGQRVWVLAKIEGESISPIKGDVIDSYMLFSLPHEYGKSITIMHTPIRVVCMNTLTLALGGGNKDLKVVQNHRKKFDPELIKKALGMAHTKLGKYREVAKFLGSRKATHEDVSEYLRTLFPSDCDEALENPDFLSRPARKVEAVLETQPGHQYAPGTWWQAFNAVTFGTNHLLASNQEKRLNSVWYSGLRATSLKALELANDYAKKSEVA